MALIVEAVNISKLAPVSDYLVRVRVNDKVLWQGFVKGHKREDGWRELLKKIAEEGK